VAIDIWLSDGDGRDARLEALIDALLEAGFAARPRALAELPESGPRPALLWQAGDRPVERALALGQGVGEIVGPWMHPAEALARSLRQIHRLSDPPPPGHARIALGELEIDLIERQARRLGRMLGLLQREYELLCHLARHAGRPQSREALLRAIWRLRFDPGTNVVEVHVSRLRAKLDRGFAWPMLRTVRGAGYALVTDAAGN
jgi:two-component system OmpR family response regulator